VYFAGAGNNASIFEGFKIVGLNGGWSNKEKR
jgi:hypothetical protein